MSERIESLDTLKGFALLCVVYIHAKSAFVGISGAGEYLGFVLVNTARIAVPVFFLTAGYLYSVKLRERDRRGYTRSYLKKIIRYYILGSLIYLLLQAGVMLGNQFLGLSLVSSILELNLWGLEGVFQFLYVGRAVAQHLWFLTALFYSLLIIYLFENRDMTGKLLLISAGFHLLGVLHKGYGFLEFLPVPKNNMLFFGLFLTAAGLMIERREISSLKSRRFFLGLTGMFGVLHLGERVLITQTLEVSPYFWADYSLFTAPLAISVMLYGLCHQNLGENSFFNRYGSDTIWGYILHPAVLGLYIGVTVLIERVLGVSLMGSVQWVLTATILTYFTTMEMLTIDLREKAGHLLNIIYKN